MATPVTSPDVGSASAASAGADGITDVVRAFVVRGMRNYA
jgi:hypothetical protein